MLYERKTFYASIFSCCDASESFIEYIYDSCRKCSVFVSFFFCPSSFVSIVHFIDSEHILNGIIMVVSQSDGVPNEFLNITFWIFNYYFWNQNGTVSYDWQSIRKNKKGNYVIFDSWKCAANWNISHGIWINQIILNNERTMQRYLLYRIPLKKCVVSFFICLNHICALRKKMCTTLLSLWSWFYLMSKLCIKYSYFTGTVYTR